jgi:hypothetical protein
MSQGHCPTNPIAVSRQVLRHAAYGFDVGKVNNASGNNK